MLMKPILTIILVYVLTFLTSTLALTCEPYCIWSPTIQFHPPRQCDQIKCTFSANNCNKCLAQCTKRAFSSTNLTQHCKAICENQDDKLTQECQPTCALICATQSPELKYELVCKQHDLCTSPSKSSPSATGDHNSHRDNNDEDLIISDADDRHEDDLFDYIHDNVDNLHDQPRDIATSTGLKMPKEKIHRPCNNLNHNHNHQNERHDIENGEESSNCDDQDSFEYEANHYEDNSLELDPSLKENEPNITSQYDDGNQPPSKQRKLHHQRQHQQEKKKEHKSENDQKNKDSRKNPMIETIIEKCCSCDNIKHLIQSYQSASSKLIKSIELIDSKKIPTFVELLHQYHLTGFPSCCECAPEPISQPS